MTDPTERNRLDEAESPYLRQHADNPVNWQPWDEQALAAARERDVPIFLSIGYSACHWCHVMAEESFEDPETAEILNEHFVPIKVDREERPDLDSVYMSICQQVTGRGGWPLSVWLTPEGKPFYVGTYFPDEERRGMPAFPDLLRDIADSWADEDQREEMHNRARQWTEAIESDLSQPTPSTDGETPEGALEVAANAALRGADREYGGWGAGGGPKFPQPGRLHVLLRGAARDGREGAREVATETLDAMVEGGLHDHVGGGFHRYCTDREWVVPHFEKMLYDNAEIPRALLAGYQATGEQRYAEAVAETIDFLNRELSHPDGGFYSTLDARSVPPEGRAEGDSEAVDNGNDETGDAGEGAEPAGEEGAFYVWTPAEIHAAVDDETAATLFCERYGVTDRGNFEGKTVLTRSAGVDDLAADHDLPREDVREKLVTAREQVFAAREDRPRPARDEKVLAGWNGLTISMLAEASLVLDGGHADRVQGALSFVREHLWDGDAGRLKRRFRDGSVAIDGYLEDYAFLARGALDVYGATGDVDALAFALELARAIEREFWDGEDETLYFTAESGEALVARPQERTDQSTPSSMGVAVSTLLALDHFQTDDRLGEVAESVLATHADDIEGNPMEHASLVLAADQCEHGSVELTLAADDWPEEWRATLAETYVPTRLLAPRPAEESTLEAWLDTLGLDEAPPIWADRGAREGPTVYACRAFACSPPKDELADAIEWARE